MTKVAKKIAKDLLDIEAVFLNLMSRLPGLVA